MKIKLNMNIDVKMGLIMMTWKIKLCIPVGDKYIPVWDKYIPVWDKYIPVGDKYIPVGDR